MRTIRGDLDLMTLPEILQWAELGQKDGTLMITLGNISKFFFFQDGKIIFFTSQKSSERLSEYLVASQAIDQPSLNRALAESKKLCIPFTAYMISEKKIALEVITSALEKLVKIAIIDVLQWNSAVFVFKEAIPEAVINGPIKLAIANILFESTVEYDEISATRGLQKISKLQAELISRIETGRIDLPATPSILIKLNKAAQADSATSQDIAKIIMSDQTLASKILKVVNSACFMISAKQCSSPFCRTRN